MITRKLKTLLGGKLIALYIFLASCSSDDGPLPDVSGTLMGSWNAVSITISELRVNELDLFDYFKSIGYPDDIANDFKEAIENGFTESFDAKFNFLEEGVYEAVYEDSSLEGTWAITDENKNIIFDQGTEQEYTMEIIELSDSKFEAAVQEVDATEDYDGDGENDELTVSILLTLDRE